MKLKTGWYVAGVVLALAMIARAGIIIYNNQNFVNDPALAYNNTYVLDLQSLGLNTLSAQAVYSSATIANVPFSDGSQSTGGFTVSNYAALSTAAASDSLTVVSTSNLDAAVLTLPGFVLINGIDWATQSTTSGTAESIKSALQTVPFLSVSRSGSVVYATAPAGSYYNSFGFTSSNSSVTIANPFFTGGLDNATLKINGVALRQGLNWNAGGSNAAAATSIASAINAAPILSSLVRAQAIGAVVTATSTLTGLSRNYLLQSSTPSALVPSGSNMTGGTNQAVALNSSVFTTPNGNTLSLALPLLYSGTPAIGGLVSQTTYYSVPVTGNSFMLAKYSTSAVIGNIDLVTVTSTNTQTTANTYTLAPLGISGTPGLLWDVSNDNTHWLSLAVSSVTISSYVPGGDITVWSFGFIGTRYLRLNAKAPTTGALNLQVQVIGTN